MLNEENILDNVNSIHFTGIGGIGMSGLAEILKHDGYTVSGSDINTSEITSKLEAQGIKFYKGNFAENIDNCDLLVYTAAVKKDNPELLAAHQKGIPAIERAQLLGCIQRKFPESIAIAGTHGKTTVTSMISCILLEADFDPSICAGGIIPNIDNNARAATSDYFVCEACEYVNSFLHLAPKYSVITNIQHDHVDFFPTIDDVIGSFRQFVSQTSDTVVINVDDTNSTLAVNNYNGNIITFGLEKGMYHTENIEYTDGYPSFDVIESGANLGNFSLKVPGEFNIYNALAAIAMCRELSVSSDVIREGLLCFTGAQRRFDYIGKCNGAPVFDDYAHHPDEMKATLEAAKKFNKNRIICVFQPHTYSRTESFMTEMADALSLADHVVLAPIYAARETNTSGISSADLSQLLPDSLYLQSFEEISDYLKNEATKEDLIIIMGAGNINCVSKMIVSQ